PIFEGDRIALSCQKEKIRRLKTMTYYKDEKELSSFKKVSVLSIQNVNVSDSGNYYCTIVAGIVRWKHTSQKVSIKVQELFQHPVLMASSFQPIEGGPLTLTCETQLHPSRSQVQLQFRFFRDSRVLGSGWNNSQQLLVPAVWREDSGSYWCEAETPTHSIRKHSRASQIHVQRIPVSNVSLETLVPGGQAVEGETLDLLCSVADATGNITFSWHRQTTGARVGKKTQHALTAELRIPAVQESNSGGYYCTADNGYGPIQSKAVTVPVRVPASHPILTLRAPRAQTVVGDKVELHCEALRGSPPILYQLYHEDVTLGNGSAPSGGGVSFFLTLTTNHSGYYFCEANNGLGPQRSQRVSLNVTVPASRPILTLRTLRVPRAQAMVGDVVELHCEALTGSPPILYRFYHEDITLRNSSVRSGGGVSFNLSLTTEHSGNYSCEADNGLGAQRSEMVTLSVTGTPRSRTGLVTGGAILGLLSVLGLAATAATAALLCHFRTQRKSRGLPATGTSSCSLHEYQVAPLSRPSRREPAHQESLTLPQLRSVHTSVNPEDSDIVYSQIWSFKYTAENSANLPAMHREDKEHEIFYSKLKEVPHNDSTGL
uniref:Ig-like domain-containing protein n=1 Tax=Otolemur garnettii TaxID=30611 RepID=H0WRR1_OTOGA